MIEAVAWGLGTGLSVFAISGTVKSLWGQRKTCPFHPRMEKAILLIAAYVTDKATQEGRDLNKEIISLVSGTNGNGLSK
jgi:hypothetical protein